MAVIVQPIGVPFFLKADTMSDELVATLLAELAEIKQRLNGRETAEPEWYTTAEVGRKLKRPVSAVTIAGHCRSGRIKAVKTGALKQDPYKIHRDEVKRLFTEGYRPVGRKPINLISFGME
jgi:hypothetical protein